METAALYSFMSHHRYCVISSISRDGNPQSALVGIAVTPKLEIVFDTLRSSRKYANLVAAPYCSCVVGLDGEQTVQLEGIAVEPIGLDLERFQQLYFSVWPAGKARKQWPTIAYFVVKPRWVRYSDFDRSPPLIEEMTTSRED